jgi:undecaprenyl-diphosphatase
VAVDASDRVTLVAVYHRLVDLLRSQWLALGVLTVAALVTATVTLTLFGLLSAWVVSDPLSVADSLLMKATLPWRSPALTAGMRAASWLGSGEFAIPFGILFYAWLRHRKRIRAATFYLWVVLSGWALNGLTKELFHRVRPQVIPRLAHAGWYSFPSGHSMMAPLVFGLAAAILLPEVPSRTGRGLLLGGTSVLCLVIAFSRVYLGVHYPTDVVGALLAGMGWGAFWVYLTERVRARRQLAAGSERVKAAP